MLPVIRALMQEESTARMPLSVDTFYAEVAAAAVEAGATMVNDVSGGSLDPHMFRQVGAVYTVLWGLSVCPHALPARVAPVQQRGKGCFCLPAPLLSCPAAGG